MKAKAKSLRTQVASAVWLVAVLCAVVLAVGALLVALKANQDNSIVTLVLRAADAIDGPLSRHNGIFAFSGKDAATKNALVNWGIAAVVYLVAGKIVDRVIRP